MDAHAPPSFGRAHEVELVHAWVNAANAGPGSALLIEGEPGIGKTHLLGEIDRAARARRLPVRWLRAHPTFGAAPFFVWRSVIASAKWSDTGGLEADPARRAAFFDDVIDALSLGDGGSPTVVIIDDAQWADPDSVEVIGYLVRELHRLPVRVVIASRPVRDMSAWARVRNEIVREPRIEILPISGLDLEGTTELFAHVAGSTVDGDDAERLHQLTAGNPFFVRELARSFRSTGDWKQSTSVADSITANVCHLGDEPRALVQAAAVIGEQFRLVTLAGVLDRSVLGLRSALEEAKRAGILVEADEPGSWRFVHALAHDACLGTIAADEQRALHARIAAVIEADPGVSAAEIAWHHLSAQDEETAAATWSARAGREAADAFAFEDGARWFERAIEWSRSDEATAELLIEQARAWWMAGRLEECRTAIDRTTESARNADRAELAARAALIPEPTGVMTWDRWIAQRCADALVGVAVDPEAVELRAQLHARHAEALLYAADYDGADEESDRALKAADDCGTAPAVLAAIRARQVVASGPEHHDERVTLADRMITTGVTLRRPDVEQWGRLWRIDTHWERGDPAAVNEELPRLRWCTDQVGTPRARWHLLVARAALEAAQARFPEATSTAREAFEIAVRADIASAGFGAYMNLLGVVGHHIGHDQAMATLPDGLNGDEPVDEGEVRDSIFSYLGPAVALAEAGRLDNARELYRQAGPPSTWRPPPYLRVPAWAYGILAALPLGLDDDLAVLRGRLEDERGCTVVVGAGVAAYGGPVELYLAKAAAHLGDLDAAVDDLEIALKHTTDNGLPCFEAEVCIELADALHRRGGPDDAPRAFEVIRRGGQLADRYGMTPWQERAIGLQERLSPRDDDPLTRREREVADLVVQGMTNRQIADALYISERTAQTHVQHILTKLGFTTRTQIAAWVTTGKSAADVNQ
jgi:DNA-binding CsgD family transcriptional regulator